MILIDTGPLVALFDPQDAKHAECSETLKKINGPLMTTVPVLTEAVHILDPASRGTRALAEFVRKGGLRIWFLHEQGLLRAWELMERYSDQPMDLADASILVAAEALDTRKVFTLDRRDFGVYRIRRGHRQLPVQILP